MRNDKNFGAVYATVNKDDAAREKEIVFGAVYATVNFVGFG